jgi:hypothetical protein
MQYAIKDIRANPFRHIDRYPIRRDKVAALKESLRTTGFWGNVVARLEDGKPQIAYGHHRLVALREEYGPDRKVDLIVRDLPDEAMLKIMARENMEEWGTSAAVEHETVRAVVEAYAADQIRLPMPPQSIPAAQIRNAPSFIRNEGGPPTGRRPYTGREVAEFLGWLKPNGETQDKVKDALAALEFIEEGILTEADFDSLTTMQAKAVVEQARKATVDREAAARIQQREAEQAERDAKQAEQRRAAAEKEREQREAQAARARDETSRQRAADQARRAQAAAREAEQAKQLAEKRQAAATRREQEERSRGRQQARTTGQHVSKAMRSGETGYKQAAEAADEVREKRQGPPPHIDEFARKLATNLNKILDADRDDRAKGLEVLLKFHSAMSWSSGSELVAELKGISERALGYVNRLEGEKPVEPGPSTKVTVQQQSRPALPGKKS